MLNKTQALILASALGLGSALGLHLFITSHGAPLRSVPLVRVTREVPAGTVLNAAEVELTHVPASAVPAQAVRALRQAIGQRAALDLVPGQDLLPADLGSQALRDGLLAGQVGFTIPVSSPPAGAGLRPGSLVSVIAVPNAQNLMPGVEPPPPATLPTARVIGVYTQAGVPVEASIGSKGGLANVGAGNVGVVSAVRLAVTPAYARLLAAHLAHDTLYIAEDPWGSAR